MIMEPPRKVRRLIRQLQSSDSPEEEEEEEEISIYFKVIKNLVLKVKTVWTIKKIKEMLCKKEGISENLQELFFEGNRLKDDQRLVECGINKNSTLHLFLQNLIGMKVFVKIPSKQETIMLEVKTCETIQNVKTMIQTKEGIQSDQFSLFYAGKQLKDKKTLASVNIKRESTLDLVFNSRDVLSTFGVTQTLFFESLEEEIDLYFKVVKTIALRVNRCETIKSLKTMLSEKEGISETFQELFFADDRLHNGQTLIDCGIKKNSTLHLFLQNLVGMKVFVYIASKQRTIMLEVKTYEIIQNIKTMIQTKEGIQSDQFSLFYSGKQLEDNRTLSSLNIKSGSTLHLVINPRDMLSICVKTHAGKIEKLEVKVLYTVQDVKAIVGSMTGIPVCDMCIIYKAKVLEESKMLSYYDIKQESILEILPPPVWIFVKTINGKSVPLALDLGDTVKDLKDKIFKKLNLPVDFQRLFYAGRCLKEGEDLGSYDIQKDSTIHVRVFLSSGSDNIEFSLSELGNIPAGTTICELKATIQTRMPRQVKELYFRGLKLQEELTLARCGIEKKSTVGVLLTSTKEK